MQSQYASRTIARTTNMVCEGELLQIENRNNLDLTEATYLEIIKRKTAVLCAACCELGAKLSGAGDDVVKRMGVFGMNVGMAFQIQDDILDIVSDVPHHQKNTGHRC